ncbi:hypothetical protein D9619_007282 [Psilocybe cf. subviscida]|uniref:Phytocyanin domain-containing protein n=1 Tax=Psilocybe cf. subviscida TaxID=2480587 RepID=A0A8H5EX16_9AGAR|nr:hypothetical protein D9619_007282 [Psilocybe cf. subviscida]
MQIITSLVFAASALVSVVSAVNHTVTVGLDNKNIFEPTSLTNVAVGDFVAFKFATKNHTVTQSSFTEPCVAKPGGVNSGFVPVPAASTNLPEWTIQIDNVTAPLWFYCAQGAHCKAGMVFAVNPTPERTFAAFQATAQGTTAPPAPGGSTGAGAPQPGPGAGAAGSPSTNASATDSAGASQPTTPASSATGLSSSARSMTLLAALGVVASLTL